MRATKGIGSTGLLFSSIPQKLLNHSHWSVVADGPLWSVPWAALVSSPAADSAYLVESKSLDLLPSATWLLRPKASLESNTMLAAGNAIHNRADSRWRPAQSTSTAVPLSFWVWPRVRTAPRAEPLELPGLAGSRRELSDSCRAWTAGPCTILSGAEFTFESLTREIARRPAVVHLATHMLTKPNPDSAASGPELGYDFRAIPGLGQAFLALSLRPDLTREIIQPGDVSRLYAPGTLIVMSSCGSGQGTVLAGAGLQGFGRAWLASGARGVVATLWAVSDETSQLFSSFYTELSSDRRPAQALRLAQLQALRRRDWQSKPLFWAAYMLLGKE